MSRNVICRMFGHNDEPLTSRVDRSPIVLHGMFCRRCHRTIFADATSAPVSAQENANDS